MILSMDFYCLAGLPHQYGLHQAGTVCRIWNGLCSKQASRFRRSFIWYKNKNKNFALFNKNCKVINLKSLNSTKARTVLIIQTQVLIPSGPPVQIQIPFGHPHTTLFVGPVHRCAGLKEFKHQTKKQCLYQFDANFSWIQYQITITYYLEHTQIYSCDRWQIDNFTPTWNKSLMKF